MARSTGLRARRDVTLDALTTLVGPVLAGTMGRPAETRTGTARILTTPLNSQNVFRIIAKGDASAAGTYTIQAAHVPLGSTTISAYATIAVITLAPGQQSIPVDGVTVENLVRTAGSVTGEVRAVAVRAVAGTAGNAPAGLNTIFLDYVS
jgi:hypothetical protein